MKSVIAFFLMVFILSNTFTQSYPDSIFTNYFNRNGTGWNAGDGTSSVLLPDGRTLWMFGDSHVDQALSNDNELPCLFNTRNSIMVQDANDLTHFTTYYDTLGTDPYTRQFIKVTGEDRITYWPAGGFTFQNTAYLFWNRYEEDNTDSLLGVRFVGMVIAEVSLPDITLSKITPLADTTLEYGMAIITDEMAGYHYIYGRKKENNVTQLVLARCPIGQIYADWEYFAGDDNWENNAFNQQSIGDNVAEEFSVFNCGNTYYLLTQQKGGALECGKGRAIFIYEAERPEGPFAQRILAYVVADQFGGEYLRTYNAQAHPQFTTNGELLISYNVNKTCSNDDCSSMPFTATYDPNLYRPKFVRIPVPICEITTTNDLIAANFVEIYPNPTTDQFQITPQSTLSSLITYELYNSLGSLVKSGQVNSSIQIADLAKGIYVVKVISPQQQQVELLLKQ